MGGRSICCSNSDSPTIIYNDNKWLASIRTSASNREVSNCSPATKIYTGAFISSAIPRYFVSLSNCCRKCRCKFPNIDAFILGKRERYGAFFNKHSFHRIASIERPILHIVRSSFVILVPIGLHANATRFNALDQRRHVVQQSAIGHCYALALDSRLDGRFGVCDAGQFSLYAHGGLLR